MGEAVDVRGVDPVGPITGDAIGTQGIYCDEDDVEVARRDLTAPPGGLNLWLPGLLDRFFPTAANDPDQGDENDDKQPSST